LQTSKIKERYDSLGVTYKGTGQTGGLIASNPSPATNPYFYHSDHLGSSSLITNLAGTTVQHVEYVPSGEVLVEERNNIWNTSYLFNAKERDDETGLYYYGARYYDPRLNLWISVDPLAEKYPNMSSYVYCDDNPIKYIDPDGRKKVVVTGGLDKHNRNSMNFINASKAQLRNYMNDVKKGGNKEGVSWIIFDLDYSKKQKQAFNRWADKNNIKISYIKTANEATSKINESANSNDKITNMSFFSHGTPSNIAFGYQNTNYSYNWNDPTNLNLSNVKSLNPAAFTNATINLFSCNAATPVENLKQDFSNRTDLINSCISLPNLVTEMSSATGQTVNGYIGRTNYAPTATGQLPIPGSTGGDYSPTVKDQSIPSIKITATNGTVTSH